MADVWIPPIMQQWTGGAKRVQVSGASIRQIIDNLERLYPGIAEHLYEVDEDRLMPGLAVFVDGEAATLGLMESVKENGEVHFLPAIGGGATAHKR
ncbi:MAG: molybdopterin synthase sulfur carrier subunit [Dehalococcoidia bacterium]|nr:molybdopterin synthase sulfur carrier subunit [Dehalococcoidia bacterium]